MSNDDVSLTVGGKKISGWDSVRVTRGIERFPSDFDLGLMDYYPGSNEKQLVTEGSPCTVKIGDDLVITGYVDDWEPGISRSRHEVRRRAEVSARTLLTALQSGPTTLSTAQMHWI